MSKTKQRHTAIRINCTALRNFIASVVELESGLRASDVITKLAIQQVVNETPRRVLGRWIAMGWFRPVRDEDYVWSEGKSFGFSQAKLALKYDVRRKLQKRKE
jgi:hypothetical protein